VILVGLFAGTFSFGSIVFALSGTPQQFKNDRNPFFTLGERFAFADVGGFAAFPAGPADGGVIDILELALPFRLLPSMLDLDPFDCSPMLPLGSLAVAPLSPVEVGDGCLFDDDLDGT
jgi:hypothetical protein